MECSVQWLGEGGMGFTAQTGSGHMVNMDSSTEAGGHNLAPRPMELLLVGAAGCAAIDVVMILRRGRQAIQGCRVEVKAERAAEDPKVFNAMAMHFRISGENIAPHSVERAVKLSAEKYCSATAMLGKTAHITHTWEIVPPSSAAAAAP